MTTAVEKAQIKKLQAEAEYFEAKARTADLEGDTKTMELADLKASPDENNIFAFYFPIGTQSVGSCMQTLGHWARKENASGEKNPFTIELCSPGGNVIAGFALVDYIRDLQAQGHIINTVGLGLVASMAAVVLQVGNARILGRNSYLMVHEIQGEFEGSLAEIQDQEKVWRRLNDRNYEILAERSKFKVPHIKRKARKMDWWLDAEESLDAGFIDEIH